MPDNFVNPYNFVAYDSEKIKRNIDVKKKDSSNLHTGYISCRLITRTPLAIPDTHEGTAINGHYSYPFMRINGEIMIPGSSIRGVIRSTYEAVTDSCMVTAREDSITARTDSSDAYKPCVLKYENGQWNLYKARRVSWYIEGKNHKQFNSCKVKGETYRWGDKVFITEKKQIKSSTVKKIWHKATQETKIFGYVYIGEYFPNKHAESVFVISENPDMILDVGRELKRLEETLNDYRSEKLNKQLDKKHHGYPGYEYAKQNGSIPLWYKKKGDHVYLSLAAIGRMAYENNLISLEGHPCNDRTELCPACSLFGMISDAPGESFGSRIRINDAELEKDTGRKKVTLRELGEPRPSYLPFYAKDAKGYDDTDSGIRGRKYYWHHPDAAKNSSEYQTDKQTKRNSTMELQNPGSEFVFRIYYNGISEEQLQELEWVLTFGENTRASSLCHKFGHGKPLGLGSAKVIIEKRFERKLKSGKYLVSLSTVPEKIDATARIMNSTGYEDMCMIADFNAISDEISYPYVGDREDRENAKGNDNAALLWFKNNKPKKVGGEYKLKVITKIKDTKEGKYMKMTTIGNNNRSDDSRNASNGSNNRYQHKKSESWANPHPIKPRRK